MTIIFEPLHFSALHNSVNGTEKSIECIPSLSLRIVFQSHVATNILSILKNWNEIARISSKSAAFEPLEASILSAYYVELLAVQSFCLSLRRTTRR